MKNFRDAPTPVLYVLVAVGVLAFVLSTFNSARHDLAWHTAIGVVGVVLIVGGGSRLLVAGTSGNANEPIVLLA